MKTLNKANLKNLGLALIGSAMMVACGSEPTTNNQLLALNQGYNDSMASCLPNVAGVAILERGKGFIGRNKEVLEVIIFKNADGSINAAGRLSVPSIDAFTGRSYSGAPQTGAGFDGCLQATAARHEAYSPYTNIAVNLVGNGVTVSVGNNFQGGAYIAGDQLRSTGYGVTVQFNGRDLVSTDSEPYGY